MLLAGKRTVADEQLQFGVHHVMGQASPTGIHTGLGEVDGQLRPGLRLLDRKGRDDHLGGRIELGVGEIDRLVRAGHEPVDPVCGQAHHPGEVLWKDEVPRRPEHVGPDEAARGEGLVEAPVGAAVDPSADGPPGHREVLGLDAAEMADDVDNR